MKFSLRNLEKDILKSNSNNENSFWVVENSFNDIIGCIGVRFNSSNNSKINTSTKENNDENKIEIDELVIRDLRCEVIHMCVIEGYRNLGIAKSLLQQVFNIFICIY